MSSYSEFIQKMRDKDLKFFYGEIHRVSNKYFTFKRFIDEDNIIIITDNIKVIKGSYALIVGDNKAVFLKDWCVRPVRNYDLGINSYAVKLNRKYFKVYTFKEPFDEMYFGDRVDDFDSLIADAKAQDEANMKIAEGHFLY